VGSDAGNVPRFEILLLFTHYKLHIHQLDYHTSVLFSDVEQSSSPDAEIVAEVLKALGEEASDDDAEPIVSAIETLSIADAAVIVSLPSAPQNGVIAEHTPITEGVADDTQAQIQNQLPADQTDLVVEIIEPDPSALVQINAEGIADTEGGPQPSPILNLVGASRPPVEDIPSESKTYFPYSSSLLIFLFYIYFYNIVSPLGTSFMGKRLMTEPHPEEPSASRQRVKDSTNSGQSVSLDITRSVNTFLEGPHHSFHEVNSSFINSFLISTTFDVSPSLLLRFFFLAS
jgi:hypothetical protein